MSLTVKNCLNRWCLRSAHGGGAIGLVRLLREGRMHDMPEVDLNGRPPARLACIAPYCDHWEVIDAEHGNCLIRSLFKGAAEPAACQ